jgi:hypothetical protein
MFKGKEFWWRSTVGCFTRERQGVSWWFHKHDPGTDISAWQLESLNRLGLVKSGILKTITAWDAPMVDSRSRRLSVFVWWSGHLSICGAFWFPRDIYLRYVMLCYVQEYKVCPIRYMSPWDAEHGPSGVWYEDFSTNTFLRNERIPPFLAPQPHIKFYDKNNSCTSTLTPQVTNQITRYDFKSKVSPRHRGRRNAVFTLTLNHRISSLSSSDIRHLD